MLRFHERSAPAVALAATGSLEHPGHVGSPEPTSGGHAIVPRLVCVSGSSALLVDRLQAPIREALNERNRVYLVEIDAIGCVGEVLVTISSSRGRLPLLFGREDLEPGYVHRIVSDTVARFGL